MSDADIINYQVGFLCDPENDVEEKLHQKV